MPRTSTHTQRNLGLLGLLAEKPHLRRRLRKLRRSKTRPWRAPEPSSMPAKRPNDMAMSNLSGGND
jgi:hypothetical protein